MFCAVRQFAFQPFPEQVFDLQRQAQQRVTRFFRSRIGCRDKNIFHFGIVQCRNNGCRHHAAGDAGGGQLAQRFDALWRGGGARLHDAGNAAVQRCHRNKDFDQPFGGHGSQNVQIARQSGPIWSQSKRGCLNSHSTAMMERMTFRSRSTG